jgi:hypothetical protein
MTNGTAPGPGVDAQGRPVIDPTANVIANLDAAVQRQDDLRNLESKHVREIMALRASYEGKLSEAESKRIDAIRAVDVGAVSRAAEVATATAQTLATQVAVSAETLRAQVSSVATASASALTTALEPLQKDITDLRRAQYEAQGQKTQVVESQAATGGSRQWIGLIIAGAAVVSAFLLGAAGIVITWLLRSSGQ